MTPTTTPHGERPDAGGGASSSCTRCRAATAVVAHREITRCWCYARAARPEVLSVWHGAVVGVLVYRGCGRRSQWRPLT